MELHQESRSEGPRRRATARSGRVARLWARVREWYHCRLGCFRYRRGHLAAAKAHFLEARNIGAGARGIANTYTVHLNLGRIYLSQQRVHLALEELQRARELDPGRFRREGFPADPVLWMASQIPEGPSCTNGLEAAAASLDPCDPRRAEELEGDFLELPYGDFADRAEAERFSLLPPIALSEVEELDWSELERLLREES